MRIRLAFIVLALGTAAAWSTVGVFSQDGTDEPDGCCWLMGWEEASFMGSDYVVRGPGEWPRWDEEFGSIEVGSCAKVTVWSEASFKGESVELLQGEKRDEFDSDRYESMKMTCD
jgi:hypothetical protein